jgi:hypothetical protein
MKARRHRALREARALDPTSLEAIERFVRVLARCGSPPREIARAVSRECAKLPRELQAKAASGARELIDVSHVLTMWFSDPLYLDRTGTPIRLAVHGPAPSLAALLQRAAPSLNVEDVRRYLVRAKAIRRVGSRYVPAKRELSLRGSEGPTHFRSLRGLVGMLRTLEHNTLPKRAARSWFEYIAENPAFPVRMLAAFDERLDRVGMRFLHAIDADMHRRERAGKASEPTVRIGVGVYRFDDTGDPLARARRSRRKPRSASKERR